MKVESVARTFRSTMLTQLRTGMYPAGLGGRTAMEQILDEDAFSHVAAHVKAQPGEVTTAQADHADPGSLGLERMTDCY